MPQKRQFGTKRRRETVSAPSPKKKPKFSPRKVPEIKKFSPRKVREERLTSHIKDTETNYKPRIREVSNRAERAALGKKASRDDKTARDEPTRVETHHPVTSKNKTQINEISAAPSANVADPSPATAAPLLPALQCPTIFSLRMFSRIYGREYESAVSTSPANPPRSTDLVQRSAGAEPEMPPTISGSPSQRLSPPKCSHVTPEDIRIYLGVENILNSDTSQSSDSIHFEVKPIATSSVGPQNVHANNVKTASYDKPQNVDAKISSKVTEADRESGQEHAELPVKQFEVSIHSAGAAELHCVPSILPEDKPGHQKHVQFPLMKLPVHLPPPVESDSHPSIPPEKEAEHQKRTEFQLKKLEVPIHEPPTIEPHPVLSVPPESTKDLSSEVKHSLLEQSSAKSPPAKIGLAALGKTRQQMVAAVRPIQTLVAQDIPAVVGKSDQDRWAECTPKSSNENSPNSGKAEINSGVRSAEKSSRHLRIPGLSGSPKGRTARQVFAPISNQWNSSHSGAGNLCDGDKKSCSEMPVVKTVSVTSELTVRVEDSKLYELKKQSSAEALFGSPVKWADDSLDSPVTDGSASSRRLYSIFGSPLKSFDSNSSEHPFSIPPTAYEDSCWTNQVPDKVLTNSSAGDASLQKQSQKSQEPVETNSKVKSIDQNEAEKVATRSFFPPPPLSVIKKHVSIFSPVKDSKLSAASNFPDEPSRSNTGICFPFARSQYEDSVLGQFDDTAQFVSALSKVDTQISPLSTPVKSGEGSNHTPSVIVEKNPTSFQQVFKANGPEGTQQIHESPNLGNDPVVSESAETPNLPVLPKGSSNEEHATGAHSQCVLPRHSSNEESEIANRNETTDNAKNLKPEKIAEPPTITITAPKTESSVRLIHRPNFASSTMLSVKSWFPDAPVKTVTPRKTPRLVSRVNRSTSPKGLDVSCARIAINDAFIIEQEERVRRWELDLYENTRSGSGSPMKNANESPTRKRIESPGKISPSKRSPRKQINPCKARRAEVHRGAVVEPAFKSAAGAATASSSASYKDTAQNQHNPCSSNQATSDACSVDAASRQILPEPMKSVPSATQKAFTMIGAVIQKHQEPRFESFLIAEVSKSEEEAAPRSVDVTIKGDEHQAGDKDTFVDKIGPEPPSGPTLKIVSSVVAESEYTVCPFAETCLQNASTEQVLLIKPSVSDSSKIPPLSKPVPLNDKCSPIEGTLNVRENVPESNGVGYENSSDTKNVTHAEASKVSPNHPKQSTQFNANGNKKQRIAILGRNNYAASTPIVPSKSTGSSECHTIKSNKGPSNGEPTRKKFRNSSKYNAIIARMKPSTPLNRAVAALLSSSTSSISPSSSHQTITAIASTKKSAFKRSSALKSDKNVTGNNLMNSVRSTFFQGTPTSSVKTDSGAETRSAQSNIQPKLIRRKNKPNLSVNFTNKVSVKTRHSPVVDQSQQKLATAENVGSRAPVTLTKDGVEISKTAAEIVTRYNLARIEAPTPKIRDSVPLLEKPAEMECKVPGQWKLHEVDNHTKPMSLLQRFRDSKDELLHPLDMMPKEKSSAETDGSKVENDTTTSAAQSSGLNGPRGTVCREKSDTQHIPEPNGVKVLNRGGAKFPLKSPVFPRSSRRTILLDSPLKMETPSKGKKLRGESVESPKPKENCEESSKFREKCGESKPGKKVRRMTLENKSPKKPNKESRSRSTSGRNVRTEDSSVKESSEEGRLGEITPENTSPKGSNKKHVEPRRSRADSPGQGRSRNRSRDRSRDCRSRERYRDHRFRYRSQDHRPRKRYRSRRSRDGSRSVSPRRSRRENSDISPKPNKKGRSPCHSPERPPVRKSSSSSDRKPKIAANESARGKSKANNQKLLERETKTASSESVGRRSKLGAADSVAKRSKASTSDSACRSSKISSTESANENPKIARPEPADDLPVVQITASAPRQTTASVPLTNSVTPPAKVTSAQPRNSETPRYVEFRTSPGISSSTPRVQAAANPSRSGPALVIRRNRKPNFSSASAAEQPEIVISAGERPALFSKPS